MRLHECGKLHPSQHHVLTDIRFVLLCRIFNRVNALHVFESSNLAWFIGWVWLHLFTDLFLFPLMPEEKANDVTWICYVVKTGPPL